MNYGIYRYGTYDWKIMPEDYNESYYNTTDSLKGKKFIIIDYRTNREYEFPIYHDNKLIVDDALNNQDFFNFLYKTAPDFDFSSVPEKYKNPKLIDWNTECLDPFTSSEKEKVNKLIKRVPEVIKYIPKEYFSVEIVNVICEKGLLSDIERVPESFMTDELYEKAFNNIKDSREKGKLIFENFFDRILTSSNIVEAIECVMLYLEAKDLNNYRYSSIFYTSQERRYYAKRDYKNNLEKFLSHIESLINVDVSLKMIDVSKDLIQYIPEKNFTDEVIKKIMNKETEKCLSLIPSDLITKELILLAIKNNGLALSGVPKEMIDSTICELAFSNTVESLKYIPNQYKTREMCKQAVIKTPKLIRNVPIDILDKNFYEELISFQIIFSPKEESYIKSCLMVNEQNEKIINGENIEQNSTELKTHEQIPDEIYEIDINELKLYFSSFAFEHLVSLGIKNLGQLFQYSPKNEFINYFSNTKFYSEVLNTIKLLKVKYLNKEPLIKIDDESLSQEEVYNLLGLTTRAKKVLIQSGYIENAKDFFGKIKEDGESTWLYRLKHTGKNTILEILEKANIIIEYSERNKKEDVSPKESDNLNDELERLTKELERLKEETNDINNQISIVLSKIQEKKLQQSKGELKV